MRTRLKYTSALVGSIALCGMSMAPALGADVSQASANALTITIGGTTAFDSGTTTSTNDGSGETKTGEANPPIAVLGNQDLLDVGVLAQDTVATVNSNDRGESAACSGVAGDGAGIADVGESECLTPGDPVGVSIANLDLTGTELVDPESALGGLAALQPIIDQLVGPLTQAISDGLAPLGATGLGGTLGAVQSSCTAGPGNATSGTANIADTTLQLDVGGAPIDLVEFPASPPPNTEVVTDLDVVLNTVLEALRVDLNNTLDGQAAPLQAIIDPIQDQIVDTLIAEIADNLQPLEDNILRATLNRQTSPQNGVIEVTALALEVLPAAAQFTDAPLVGIDIATVSCGPSARVVEDDDDDDDGDGGGNGGNGGNGGSGGSGGGGQVPTTVDAGEGAQLTFANGLAGAALMLLAGLAGLAGYRRFVTS